MAKNNAINEYQTKGDILFDKIIDILDFIISIIAHILLLIFLFIIFIISTIGIKHYYIYI
jgi:hypothetical protein